MIFQFLDTYEILQDICGFKITLRIKLLFNHTFYVNIYIYIKISYFQLSLVSSKAVPILKGNPTFLVSLKSMICWESKWEMVKTFVNNQSVIKLIFNIILLSLVFFSTPLFLIHLFPF